MMCGINTGFCYSVKTYIQVSLYPVSPGQHTSLPLPWIKGDFVTAVGRREGPPSFIPSCLDKTFVPGTHSYMQEVGMLADCI